MIDIIIPAYNAHNTIKKTLLSIANQDNVDDIKVYIINDCSKQNYSKEIEMFKKLMYIEEMTLTKNSGPGAARQYGLERTHSKYVLFMDADDLFYNNLSCQLLVNAIDGFDMSKGRIIEDIGNGNFSEYEDEYSLHGKLYRRSIIEKNNIEFNSYWCKGTNAHDDAAFNNLYELCCNSINIIDDLVYKYEYNVNSITKNAISQYADIESFIRAMDWLSLEVEKRQIKNHKEIARKFSFIMIYCYFFYQLDIDNYSFMFEKMKNIKKIYIKYFNEIDYQQILDIYYSFKYPFIPFITLDDFVDKIKG